MWLEIAQSGDSNSPDLPGFWLINLDNVRRIKARKSSNEIFLVEADFSNGDRETIAVRKTAEEAMAIVSSISGRLLLQRKEPQEVISIDFGVWPARPQRPVSSKVAPTSHQSFLDPDDDDPFAE